jgi:hypothetical protein
MSQSSVKRHPSGQIPARHRELSDQVLKRYREKCVATKSLTALANVVEACDFLENQGLEITVAAVGGFCGGRPGGPKSQSIRNNPDLKSYVVARRSEQTRSSRESQHTPLRTGDLNVDSYIQMLESELRQLKGELRALRHAIPRLGEYDFEAAIHSGQLVISAPCQQQLPPEAVSGIKTLFDAEALAAVGLVLVPTGQIVAPELNDAIFLSKSQMDAFRAIVEEHSRSPRQ